MPHQTHQSILKKTYQKAPIDERLAMTIHQQFGVALCVARVLAAKNFTNGINREFNFEEIENFLNPTIKASLPDPFMLLDMEVAVEKIISVIKANKKITVFGDYDVDGATSSAILKRYFRSLGIEVGI